jgi:hypothetical protein
MLMYEVTIVNLQKPMVQFILFVTPMTLLYIFCLFI